MKKIYFIAAVLFTVAACTREPINPEETKTKGPFKVTLIADNPETRTELGTENGVLKPFWSEEDAILVMTVPGTEWEEGCQSFIFDSDVEDRSSTARFYGLPYEPGSYIASYPYIQRTYYDDGTWYDNNPSISFNGGTGRIEYRVPTVQRPTLNSFDPYADILISEPFSIEYDDYDEEAECVIVDGICFTRMNAIVKIVLQDKTSNHKFTGQTVRAVTLSTVNPDQMGGGGVLQAPRVTRAEVWNNEDDEEPLEYGGLAGWVSYSFPAQEGEDGYSVDYAEERYVTAEYTDETYQIGDEGAATYLITVPRILKNADVWGYDENGDWNVTGEKDGLYIRVETDDFIITRNIDLRNGIALQPSRVTTLNIGLKDESNGTTFVEKGIVMDLTETTLMPEDGEYVYLYAKELYFPEYEMRSEEGFQEYFSLSPEGFSLHYDSDETYVSDSYISNAYFMVNSSVPAGDYNVTITFNGTYSTNCLVHVITSSNPITFADPLVKSICVSNWGDHLIEGELTEYEASKVKSLGTSFQRTAITSFNELTYFTGLDDLDNAFEQCGDLTSVSLPETFNGNMTNTFYLCDDLESFTFPENYSGYTDGAFSSCSSLESITIPDSMTAIGSEAFSACKSLTTVNISQNSNLTEIHDKAFSGCRSLTGIYLPGSLTEIGNSAFDNCESLTSIDVPGSVSTLKQYVFASCKNLTSVTLNEGLREIWGYAFMHCTSLRQIEFPASLNTIASSYPFGLDDVFFYSGNGYAGVTFKGANPPYLRANHPYIKIMGKHWDEDANEWVPGVEIRVPKGSKALYESKSQITNNGENTIVEFE